MPRPAAKPDEQTTARRIVAGLSKVALAFRQSQWAASGRRGLTPTQSQILAVIVGSRSPVGVKAVAEQMAVTIATASEAVATLVDKGLLSKRPDAADRRAVVLALTARGRRESSRASDWPSAIVEAIDDIPEPERATLLRGLVGMIRTMQGHGLVPMSRMCVECRYFRPNEYPGKARPHHCQFINAPIGDADLRIDCAEMEPAADADRPRLWEVFVNGQPLDRHGPGRARPRTAKPTPRRAVHTPSKGAHP